MGVAYKIANKTSKSSGTTSPARHQVARHWGKKSGAGVVVIKREEDPVKGPYISKKNSKEHIRDKMNALSDIQIDGFKAVYDYTSDKKMRKFIENYRDASYDDINSAIAQLAVKL